MEFFFKSHNEPDEIALFLDYKQASAMLYSSNYTCKLCRVTSSTEWPMNDTQYQQHMSRGERADTCDCSHPGKCHAMRKRILKFP